MEHQTESAQLQDTHLKMANILQFQGVAFGDIGQIGVHVMMPDAIHLSMQHVHETAVLSHALEAQNALDTTKSLGLVLNHAVKVIA